MVSLEQEAIAHKMAEKMQPHVDAIAEVLNTTEDNNILQPLIASIFNSILHKVKMGWAVRFGALDASHRMELLQWIEEKLI